jgi:serine/threonine protein phosphatase 1
MTDDRSPAKAEPRLYVIGDIHGCTDLLDRIIELIHRDIERRPAAESVTVTLGDYVDRGPDSRGVIERLARNPFPTPYVALKGNHEDFLLKFLRDPLTGPLWQLNGGLETLQSYGVPVSDLILHWGYEKAAHALRDAMPQAHWTFLSSLKLSIRLGRYFLCHAGVRPGVPLDQQTDDDLMWIREEFLRSTLDFGQVIVHGHTPVKAPENLPNRINIDTAAVLTGRLTCVVLDGEERRFLSTM